MNDEMREKGRKKLRKLLYKSRADIATDEEIEEAYKILSQNEELLCHLESGHVNEVHEILSRPENIVIILDPFNEITPYYEPGNVEATTPEQIQAGQAYLWKLLQRQLDKENPVITLEMAKDMYEEMSEDTALMRILADTQEKGQERQTLVKAMKYVRAKEEVLEIRNETRGTILGTMFFGDGTAKEVTLDEFKEILQRGLDESNPDIDATDKLKVILSTLFEFIKTQPDFMADPRAVKTLDNLQFIYEYLTRDPDKELSNDLLDKFFKGEREFIAIPRPKGIDNFLKINSVGKKGIQIREYDSQIKVIRFEGNLGIEEQKIHDMFGMTCINGNHYKATKNLDTLIEIPLTQTMHYLGRPVNTNNKKQFVRKLNKEILKNIHNTYMEYEIKGKKENDYRMGRMYVGGGLYEANIKKDRITFRLSPEYAYFLNTAPLSQFNSKALYLGSRQNPLPYYLYRKLQEHYAMDANKKHGTYNILSIRKLLEFCSEIIPSYEWVQENDPGHWIRRIKDPLETALKDIKEGGLFEWEYCKRGMAEATQQDTGTRDYNKWSKLYITFKLIPEEPDQTERLQHKQERIEAAQSKKELKEAETIVKADKIQRRNTRKKKGSKQDPAASGQDKNKDNAD